MIIYQVNSNDFWAQYYIIVYQNLTNRVQKNNYWLVSDLTEFKTAVWFTFDIKTRLWLIKKIIKMSYFRWCVNDDLACRKSLTTYYVEKE